MSNKSKVNSDLLKTVKDNLFFKVDFDGSYKKEKGKITQEVKFFLIGVLPVLIEYLDGKKERAVINTPIEVESDPYLRMLHGAKYKFIEKIQKEIEKKFKLKIDYNKPAYGIVGKATEAIDKIAKAGKFNDKLINKISIIKSE